MKSIMLGFLTIGSCSTLVYRDRLPKVNQW